VDDELPAIRRARPGLFGGAQGQCELGLVVVVQVRDGAVQLPGPQSELVIRINGLMKTSATSAIAASASSASATCKY
jgi:hypothetical protein